MPSQTVYFPQDVYDHAKETRDADQSTAQRLAELAEMGVEHDA